MYGKKEIQSVIKVQARVRGFLGRQTYQVKQLSKEELEDYKVKIQGNDPVINGLPKHKTIEKVAIIGTSGMRSVELACQLSEGAPKLIIIDNSKQVINFWRHARDIMNQSDSAEQFLTPLKIYVSSSECNRPRFTEMEFAYLKALFDEHRFEQIKQIIINTVIIGQSWTDKALMMKLKNILAHNGITTIYTYSSNIAMYVNDEANTESVLRNIQQLNPAIAIHTDFIRGRAKNYFLITDHRPQNVKQTLRLEREEELSLPVNGF